MKGFCGLEHRSRDIWHMESKERKGFAAQAWELLQGSKFRKVGFRHMRDAPVTSTSPGSQGSPL